MSFLEKNIPETAEAFNEMRDSILKDGALDSRTKELIAVASSVLMRCEHCTELHSKKHFHTEQPVNRSQKPYLWQCW